MARKRFKMYFNSKLLPGTKGEFELLIDKPERFSDYSRLTPHCVDFTSDNPGYEEIHNLVAMAVRTQLEDRFLDRSANNISEILYAYSESVGSQNPAEDDEFWMFMHDVVDKVVDDIQSRTKFYVVITRLYEGSTNDIAKYNGQIIESSFMSKALGKLKIERKPLSH